MGPLTVRQRISRATGRVLGPSSWSQYTAWARARGRATRYDAKSSWNDRYERAISEGWFDDAGTISRTTSPLLAQYSYNAVENAILELALRGEIPTARTVLDVGSGAGHWIEFYRDKLDAAELVAIEISAAAAAALRDRYAGAREITVLEADAAAEGFDLGRQFDVVNAVDVLFHVVDDGHWRRAVANLSRHLAPEGRLVVAEHVSLVTHDAGFRPAEAGGPETLVYKRVRSRRAWRACAREAGLDVRGTAKIRRNRTLPTPANRLLVLAPSPSRRGQPA